MSADAVETTNGKTRKRAMAKPANPVAITKVKATIHLTAENHKRLSVHAAMLGVDRSELVESLIATHLKRFVVSDRGDRAGGSESGNDGKDESPIA